MDIERLKELQQEVGDIIFNALSKLTDKDTMEITLRFGEDLQTLIDEAIARQSAEDKNVPTSEEVAEAIEYLQPLTEHSVMSGNFVKHLKTAITALQAYQPWVGVEDMLPDGDVASVLIHTNKGGVSEGQYYPCIKSWKQFRWSVENADVTHWKPLPKPPKGE